MNKKRDSEKIEDTTMTGELIPSMFNWLEIDKQKRKAEELDRTTKK